MALRHRAAVRQSIAGTNRAWDLRAAHQHAGDQGSDAGSSEWEVRGLADSQAGPKRPDAHDATGGHGFPECAEGKSWRRAAKVRDDRSLGSAARIFGDAGLSSAGCSLGATYGSNDGDAFARAFPCC